MERTIKPETARQLITSKKAQVYDVRRKNDYDADNSKIPEATWCDPDNTAQWSKTIARDQDVVIYCVRGGSVSNAVVDQLRNQGINAAFIEGGIDAWKSAGGEIVTK